MGNVVNRFVKTGRDESGEDGKASQTLIDDIKTKNLSGYDNMSCILIFKQWK